MFLSECIRPDFYQQHVWLGRERSDGPERRQCADFRQYQFRRRGRKPDCHKQQRCCPAGQFQQPNHCGREPDHDRHAGAPAASRYRKRELGTNNRSHCGGRWKNLGLRRGGLHR